MPHETAWMCEVCHKPITDGSAAGVVNVLQPAPPRSEADEDDEIEVLSDVEIEDAASLATRQVAEAVRFLNSPAVEFHVYHVEHCAPPERLADYNIACSRVRSIDAWLAWMQHMGEKNWINKRDLLAMAAFWYSGHGRPVPRDLN